MTINRPRLHIEDYLNAAISPKHRALFPDRHRYMVVYGGAGSGKSHAIAEKLVYRLCREQGHKLLIVRKVAATLKNSVFELMQIKLAVWGLIGRANINKTDKSIEIFGNKVLFVGLDDVEKLKSIEGITGIWIEEASELKEADLDQLDLRLRGFTQNYKQIILSFNPIHKEHWIKKKFFDRHEGGASIHHSTYLDNIHIDAGYKQVFDRLKETNRAYYNIYALGQWGVFEGLVFENWKDIVAVPDDAIWTYSGYGIDFGFNAPSAVVDVYLRDKELYWDERIYQSQLTNNDLITRMKQEDIRGIGYADSAEPDRILEIKRAGFDCRAADKANRINRINFVKQFDLYITSRSTNLIKEMHTYVWAKDRQGNTMDEPVKVNDHAIDAGCYSTYTQFGGSGYNLDNL